MTVDFDNPLADSLANSSTDDRVSEIEVELSTRDLELVDELAEKRFQSYKDGRTTDDNWSDSNSGSGIHRQGLMAERGVAIAFEKAEIDEEISASGDGGIDGTVEISGESCSFDVKSSDFDGYAPSLMVAKKNVEARSEHPDIYVSAFVDESAGLVRLRGFVYSDEFLVEENLSESPASYLDHKNFDIAVDDLESLPTPDTDDERVRF